MTPKECEKTDWWEYIGEFVKIYFEKDNFITGYIGDVWKPGRDGVAEWTLDVEAYNCIEYYDEVPLGSDFMVPLAGVKRFEVIPKPKQKHYPKPTPEEQARLDREARQYAKDCKWLREIEKNKPNEPKMSIFENNIF